MIDWKAALEIILSLNVQKQKELINLENALGRVLAENIYADRDYPPFNRSAVDGFALNSKNFSNQKIYKVTNTIFAGEAFQKSVWQENECIKIMTGSPVPKGLDVVIPIEDAKFVENEVQFPIQKIALNQNIALQGEDAKKEELLLKESTFCTPQVISLLATVGKSQVHVYAKPKVSLFTTGNEILPITEKPDFAQIRNSNLYILLSFFKKLQIEPIKIFHLRDEETLIYQEIKNALETSDCIICTGGVSAGEKDLLPNIFEKLGIEKKFHKVEIRPGKPVWFGVGKNGCVVFGLPGNPLAVQVTYKMFAESFLKHFSHLPKLEPIYLPINHNKTKKHSLTHFFPVRLINIENQTFLQEVSHNGSGDIKAALFSDGIAIHEKGKYQIQKDEFIPFYLW